MKRVSHATALRAATTHRHDFLGAYVGDLGNAIDMDAIRDAKIRMGVDPLGGAGVHYWARVAERYRLDLTVVSEVVDPTFGFMTLDWDGQIRMDPSSKYAMQRLQAIKDRFDIAFACDTDHDRHGIVTPGAGLLAPDHYLAVEACIRCKYMDCVEVCPVDAFREGKNMLVIDPDECWTAGCAYRNARWTPSTPERTCPKDQERYFEINAELASAGPSSPKGRRRRRTPTGGPRCATRPTCSTHEVQEMTPDSCWALP